MIRRNRNRAPDNSSDQDNDSREAEEQRRLQVASAIAAQLEELRIKDAATRLLATEEAEERARVQRPKTIPQPTDDEMIPVYIPVNPAYMQVREESKRRANPHMEGVRWTDFKGKETRISRSFKVHPLHLMSERQSALKKVWSRPSQHWEPSHHAERRWILEDSDRKLNGDEREVEYKPRKPVGEHGLEHAMNDSTGGNEALWPSWFAQGERPAVSARPSKEPLYPETEQPRTFAVKIEQTLNMFESVKRYAAGDNEYSQPFNEDFIGLRWTGMERTVWGATEYEVQSAKGTLPPKLDCQITDSWDYVDKGGDTKSWLEERRYQGVLVDVVVHDESSMVKRMQEVFAPKGKLPSAVCIPAENVTWQLPAESPAATTHMSVD